MQLQMQERLNGMAMMLAAQIEALKTRERLH